MQLHKKGAPVLLTKDAGFDLDPDTGEFTGYASIFGNRDHVGDVVMPGAFRRTIAERHPQKLIKIFRNHGESVGMPIELREDQRGLFVRGKLNLEKQIGRDTLSEIRSGELSHMSFQYDIVRQQRGEDDKGRPINKLLDLDLWEVGPVSHPANELARIESVKALRDVLGASPMDFHLGHAVALLKSQVMALGMSPALTEDERQQVKDALRELGPLTRTLSSIPRTCEDSVPPAAAPDASEQKAAPSLDLSGVMAALHNLRSAAEVHPGA